MTRLPRSLSSRDGSAIFHLDSLFVCLEGRTAEEFSAMAARMPRDLDAAAAALKSGRADDAIGFLIKHCHEFVHYHQFVGTQFGLIYRRLVAARARVREYLLQDIGADAYARLVDESDGRNALIRLVSAEQLTVHPVLRTSADPEMIELLGWLDLFEDYLLDGKASDLFDSPGRVRALLEACDAATRPKGVFEISAVLEAMSPGTSGHSRSASPIGFVAICEAQATANEYVLQARHGTGSAMEFKMRSWCDSTYWDVFKRFGWTKGTGPPEFVKMMSAVLLATDIALDGVVSPSLHEAPTGQLLLHPCQAIEALADTYQAWQHVLDSPLETWQRDDFLERRALAAHIAFACKQPTSYDISPGRPADSDDRRQAPSIQCLDIFAHLQRRVATVRRHDPAAALFPVSAIIERPETFTGFSDPIHNLACPFLSISGTPFRNLLDEETWTRWQLLSGYEIWLDNLFNGSHNNFKHLPGTVELYKLISETAAWRIGQGQVKA